MRIDPASARILLLEGGSRVLQAMPEDLSERAGEQLAKLGVEVRLNARVAGIDASSVEVKPGAGGRELHHRHPLRCLGGRCRCVASGPATGASAGSGDRPGGAHHRGARPQPAGATRRSA